MQLPFSGGGGNPGIAVADSSHTIVINHTGELKPQNGTIHS